MELLIWHEALGTDDEQATEDELLERLLYAHVALDTDARADDGDNERRIQALQFMQALVVFTGLLRKPSTSPKQAPQTIYATLAKRRFAIREVEPHVFIALGVSTEELHGKELRAVHEEFLVEIYELFCLFHGRIDQQLRQRPPELTGSASDLEDGMAVLSHIATLRKRLRKMAIAGELQDHDDAVGAVSANDQDQQRTQTRLETQELEKELSELTNASPSRRLWKRCESFFPKLLQVTETQRLSIFHALDGVTYFPMDETTFLSLQSLAHSLEFELQDMLSGGVALFFKGNLLWRSIDQPIFHKLQLFLRLRELDGMDLSVGDDNKAPPKDKASLWMQTKYDDAFSPLWASKTTYAESAVTRNIAPQLRRTGRSLHKQTSSSMSSILNELPETSRQVTAEQIQCLRGQRYRSDAPVYRNRGFLTSEGYFLPSWEIAKAETSLEVPWNPSVFKHVGDEVDATPSGALLYHQNDASVLLLTKKTDSVAATLQQMDRVETCLEKLQWSLMATVIWQRYAAMTGSANSNRDKSPSTQPPFVYLNHENLAFKAPQIPRLLRTKEDDLHPRPASLWCHYFTSAALEILNSSHDTLHSDPTAVELRVKTMHDGWLVARRSRLTHRELYAFFDTKVSSVADVQDALAELIETQFSNVFV